MDGDRSAILDGMTEDELDLIELALTLRHDYGVDGLQFFKFILTHGFDFSSEDHSAGGELTFIPTCSGAVDRLQVA